MPVPMTVSELLEPQCAVVPLNAGSKREAIDALVDAMATSGRVTDAAAVKKAVWEREQQRSTGIGEGLAIPHGKTPAAHGLCAQLEVHAAGGCELHRLCELFRDAERA